MNKGIDYYFDAVIPRGLKDQPNIFVSHSDYLSRLANFNSKYLGVKYRKEQWDKFSANHINSFKKKIKNIQRSEKLEKDMVLSSSFAYRDTRTENEFEMIIYSINCTLSALSYVISSLLTGKTKIHSHSSLAKVMNDNNDIPSLSKLVRSNFIDWAHEVKLRRDVAAHYIALLLKSRIDQKQKGNNIISKSKLYLAIPKTVRKYNVVWEQDIPVLGGAIFKSFSVVTSTEEETTREILDKNNKVIFRSNLKAEPEIELIDSIEYINSVYKKLEEYIVGALKILKTKVA